MNNPKRNITSGTLYNQTTHFTDKKCLKPISDKHKYDNANLFDFREAETRLKEEELKKNLSKAKQKSTTQLKPLNTSLYLTEANIVNDPNLFATTEDDKTNSQHPLANIHSTGANTSTNQNAVLLTTIAEKKQAMQEKALKKYIVPMLDQKDEAIQTGKKDCVRDYMSKTREIVLMKYSANIKKESAVRLKETYENELEMIKETITSMEEAKKLFNDHFLNRFHEYVRFLAFQREQEKNTDNLLVDEINKLQNDFQTIDIRKRKQENDKQILEKWLYLQIQIKEKKLELPLYYKILIEQGDIGAPTNPKKRSTQNVIALQLRRPTLRQASTMILSGLGVEEKERVLNYRKKLIFESPHELFEEFSKFEKKNLDKINVYNCLREQLRELNKEKDDIIKKELKDTVAMDNEIAVKEKVLINLRQKQEQLMREKIKLINSQGIVDKPKKKQTISFDLKLLTAPPTFYSIGTTLLMRISTLHSNLVEFISKNKEISSAIQISSSLPKKEDNETIEMIKYIELGFNKLIASYYDFLHSNRAQDVKDIKNQIEKQHKKQKAIQQKDNQLQRLEKLKNRIQGREGKIFFLPHKKLETNYGRFIRKDPKVKGKGQKCNQLTFEDFMFDMLDESNQT